MIEVLLPIHTTCVAISIVLFIWRGVAMWLEQPLTNKYYRRILPDSVDTVLLFSGISMAYMLDYSPLEQGWLAAKMIGLVMYIVLGAIALKYGQSLAVKRIFFIAALCVFAYIAAVARTMQVLPLG